MIDLSCVHCIDDLCADDNGMWIHGGKPRKQYSVEIDSDSNEVISVVPQNESIDSGKVFTLVRLYHLNQSTPTFHRRISYSIDENNQTIQYAVMQYIFEDGNEIPIVLPPHGNAKQTASSNSYHRTQKSTLVQTKGKPKSVISKLYSDVGGILEARSKS